MFRSFVRLLRKLPIGFRKIVLWGLVGISFYVCLQGLIDGSVGVGLIGLAVFAILVGVHVWMFFNPQESDL